MVCWRRGALVYCHYLRYLVRCTGRGGREWGMCCYLCEGLSTRAYGGEAERRSRDAWGKRVSSVTRVGQRTHPQLLFKSSTIPQLPAFLHAVPHVLQDATSTVRRLREFLHKAGPLLTHRSQLLFLKTPTAELHLEVA